MGASAVQRAERRPFTARNYGESCTWCSRRRTRTRTGPKARNCGAFARKKFTSTRSVSDVLLVVGPVRSVGSFHTIFPHVTLLRQPRYLSLLAQLHAANCKWRCTPLLTRPPLRSTTTWAACLVLHTAVKANVRSSIVSQSIPHKGLHSSKRIVKTLFIYLYYSPKKFFLKISIQLLHRI